MNLKIPEVEVGGHKIAAFSCIEDVVANLLGSLDRAKILVAMNPEKIMLARRDNDLRDVLQAADLRYPDGIGVVKVMRRRLGLDVARIPGCELWEQLMAKAGEGDIGVYLLGGKPTVVEMTADKLIRQYKVNIVGAHHGYFDEEEQIIKSIEDSKARIVTVALGSPRQEKFMIKCKNRNINALFMGVGGTYDVFTGVKERAPKWYLDNNLEWLYRLYKEPTRAGRQTRLVKFAVLAALGRI